MTSTNDSNTYDAIREAIAKANQLAEDVPEAALSRTYPLIFKKLAFGNGASSDVSATDAEVSPRTHGVLALLERPANEVVARVRPGSQPDRAVLLAAWMEASGYEVSVAGLNETFIDARLPSVSNMADVVGRLLGRGLLSVVSREGPYRRYAVTIDGHDYVRAMIDADEE